MASDSAGAVVTFIRRAAMSRAALHVVVTMAVASAARADSGPGLELVAGAAPLGPVGLMAAWTTPRLALGVGAGFARTVGLFGEASRHPRLGVTGRATVVSAPALSAGLVLWASRGSYSRHGAQTTEDGTPVEVWWAWRTATRADLALFLEARVERWTVRMEGGIGALVGDRECWLQFDGASTRCGPSVAMQRGLRPKAPVPLVPTIQVAIGARPGTGESLTSDGAAPGREVRLIASGTHVRLTNVFRDGRYLDSVPFNAGLDGDLLVSRSWLHYGVGARYEFGAGRGTPPTRPLVTEHFVFVPIQLGARWSWTRTGEAVELTAGFGPTAGVPAGEEHLLVAGLGGELRLEYVAALRAGVGLVVGAAARLQYFQVQNGHPEYSGAVGTHASIPLRVGLRWAI